MAYVVALITLKLSDLCSKLECLSLSDTSAGKASSFSFSKQSVKPMCHILSLYYKAVYGSNFELLIQ